MPVLEPVRSRIAWLVARHRKTSGIMHFDVNYWSSVFQLDFFGKHSGDLVILPLVHRGDGEHEDKHLTSVGSRPEGG